MMKGMIFSPHFCVSINAMINIIPKDMFSVHLGKIKPVSLPPFTALLNGRINI